MSLHPQAIEAIPEDTLRVARAAFPKGKNPIMVLRDHLSTLFSDQDFFALYSALGQPAYPPYRLMLVSVFQFMENLVVARCRMFSWSRTLYFAATARVKSWSKMGPPRMASRNIVVLPANDKVGKILLPWAMLLNGKTRFYGPIKSARVCEA